MPLIYITGISGSGKSAVRDELTKRGYEAHGTDEDGIAFFYNNETGEALTRRVTAKERTPEWRKLYTWKASRGKIAQLAEKAKDKPVFLCGTTSNDADELWDLFDKKIALHIDETTLKDRILNRTGNDFGKNPNELAMLLEWQKTAQADYEKLGAAIVDATKPLDEVVDNVLRLI